MLVFFFQFTIIQIVIGHFHTSECEKHGWGPTLLEICKRERERAPEAFLAKLSSQDTEALRKSWFLITVGLLKEPGGSRPATGQRRAELDSAPTLSFQWDISSSRTLM
jgi:hypothetical protein